MVTIENSQLHLQDSISGNSGKGHYFLPMGLSPRISRWMLMTSRILSTAALVRFLASWFCFLGEVRSSGGIGGKGSGIGRSSGDFGCCRAHCAGVGMPITPINRKNARIGTILVENPLFVDTVFLRYAQVCPRGKNIIESALRLVFSIRPKCGPLHIEKSDIVFLRAYTVVRQEQIQNNFSTCEIFHCLNRQSVWTAHSVALSTGNTKKDMDIHTGIHINKFLP